MTNYSRKSAKVFGETASAVGTDPDIGPEIGQFGSAKAGTYNGTNDIDVIQSLPAWSNGWIDAVTPSQQFPTLPERTAVDYVQSYQNAYLLQKGIAEWDSATVYYTTSYCQHNGGIYRSKVNDNIGNTPVANTSNGYWQYLGRNFLNTQQVTNCLLEVPQRMDYTLIDGELTLKTGSVVIVPYGTTDLSSTINVGDTFINAGLKVYDTCWDSTNSKFYVWVELQSDIVLASSASSGADPERPVFLLIDNSTAWIASLQKTATLSATSDSAVSLSNCVFYNTTDNLVKIKTSGTIGSTTLSFPIMITLKDSTYLSANIEQVFDGFGYIGSALWCDKDIKYLRPNGRNADGSLNNVEVTNEIVQILDVSSFTDGSQSSVFDNNGRFGHTVGYYNPYTNYWYSPYYYQASWCGVGSFAVESGKITYAIFNNALSINSMCDGQWVDSSLTIATSITAPTTTDIEYDLSNYLPNDGYNYEVIINATAMTASTSGSSCRAYIRSNLIYSPCFITRAQTRTSSTMSTEGAIIFPIGLDRKLILNSFSNNTGTINLYVRGYRRLGTNF